MKLINKPAIGGVDPDETIEVLAYFQKFPDEAVVLCRRTFAGSATVEHVSWSVGPDGSLYSGHYAFETWVDAKINEGRAEAISRWLDRCGLGEIQLRADEEAAARDAKINEGEPAASDMED